jgi:hypothetical protein
MNSVGEKGYLLRRILINNEANKLLSPKSTNKKRSTVIIRQPITSDMIKINNEYSNLEHLSKTKKIEKDEELEMIELNLKKRFLRNSIKNKKSITFRDLTPSITIGKYLNNDSSSNSINKTGKNLKLSINYSRKSEKKTTDTLNELNKLTDKLGITNKSERIDYIKEKEKKKLLKKEFRTPFKEKNHQKVTLFSSTAKLNRYIINDYYLSEYDKSSAKAKKKLKIAEMTFEQINKERMNNIYQQSQKVIIPDPDRDNFYYNLTHANLNDEDDQKRYYSEKEMEKIKENYYNNIVKQKMKKNLKLFDKIRGLNNKGYNQINPSMDIEYNNLIRVIRIKKYKHKCLNEDLTEKKKKLKNEEDKVLLCLSKFKPIILSSKPFRLSTINQYKSVSGVYFGTP